MTVVMKQNTLVSGVASEPGRQASNLFHRRVQGLAVPRARLPSLVLSLEVVADGLEGALWVERQWVDPALDAGARLRLRDIGRVDADVEADDKGYANLWLISSKI